MRRRALLSFPLLLVCGLFVQGQESPPTPGPKPLKSVLDELPDAVKLTLRTGSEDAPAVPARIPGGEPSVLDPGAAKALLDRLPALPADGAQSFAKREGPPPPERAGATVEQPFPPPYVAPTPDPTGPQQPLRVLRFQPEGEVPLVPRLSLTFSAPMVAVGSLDDLAQEAVPVRLEPQPPGSWRWIGTQTLVFEPEGERFPMATDYRVSVPEGVRAAGGEALLEGVEFGFSTPPLRLVSGLPSGTAGLEPTIALSFDQRVDAQALAPSLQLLVAGEAVPFRLATAEEAAPLGLDPARSVCLRPTAALPNAVSVQVQVSQGAASAEGPRLSSAAQTHGFRTFGPLEVVRHESGHRGRCPPGSPFRVYFNNSLDTASVTEELVRCEPEIPGLTVRAYGNQLILQGQTRAKTRYAVTLDSQFGDVFGQTLGAPQTLSFQTTEPEPRLAGDWSQVMVLDPAGKPEFRVRTIAIRKLKLRMTRVDPAAGDWAGAEQWRRALNRRDGRRSPMPGTVVLDEVRELPGDGLGWVETTIDLSPALEDGLGHVLLQVESADPDGTRGWRQRLTPWIQATRLGVDVESGYEQALVWVTQLSDGAPISGAEVRLLERTATTDARGLAELPLGSQAQLVLARKGDDVAVLPGYWQRNAQGPQLRWFTFDDRHLYRTNEQVRIKGWVRRYDPRQGGDLAPLGNASPQRDYIVHDPRGRELTRGELEFDAFGGFDLTIDIPDDANVGWANVRFAGGHAHSFQIAEFRRPEFEVKVAPQSGGPHLAGQPLRFTAQASYFAGGGLPGAELGWSVKATQGSFSPPNCDGFRFGRYRPWWAYYGPQGELYTQQQFAAQTDGRGKHTLDVSLDTLPGIGPVSLSAEASVQDVNRQSWSGSSTVLVHPARLYVGVRPALPYVPAGKPLAVDTLTVDLDGAHVAERPVVVTFERLEWTWERGASKEVVAEQHSVELTSATDPVQAQVEKPRGGLWRVVAAVTDPEGRVNRTTLQVWVAGGKAPATQRVDEEQVTLIPDQEHYAAGDVAKVLLVAPFTPAEVLVTTRRSGILTEEVRHLTTPTAVLEVPLEEGHVPGVTLHVALVGQAPRAGATDGGPTRPAFASGQVLLGVPPTQRALTLGVTPAAKELAPGSRTSVEVEVRGPSGEPLPGAQVAVCVVDEAVLFLAGYTHPDPLSAFYSERDPGVQDLRSRHMLRLQRLEKERAKGEEQSLNLDEESDDAGMAMEGGAAPGALMAKRGGGGGWGGAPPIALRKDLSALAVFAPAVTTGPDGKARVDFKLPDSLTRYRIVAMAADAGNAFGKGESTLTARLPLMVRPSAPRFLNFGDRCELPVVVQNQTDGPLEVQVALRATNLSVEGGALRVAVPARDRVEVRFPVAAVQAGTARVQVVASAGEAVDAQELSFPVWTPATSEAFATYGVIDEGGLVQPVQPPSEVWTQFGGLEVTTSSTALQSLTDAVIYLVDYPYGCAEQIASRVIALAALRDVLAAFDAEGLPSAEALQASVGRDLARLAELQSGDGGWGFWSAADRSWPYLTIHVTHALHLAQAKGYAVDARALQRGHVYLQQIEEHIPSTYSQESKWALRAYALNVRQKLEDPDVAEAKRLLEEAGVNGLSLEALGWIYPLLRESSEGQAIRRAFSNELSETAGAAHFVTSYEDGAHVLLHSARRVDGIVLEALLADPQEVKGELAPKLVAGLLAHKTQGRWYNTQENAFVLLALERYFHAAEGVEPDFVARAWLGDAFAGEHAFRGRTTERARIDVPMSWLQEAGAADLVLAKDGPGRLYYRIGLRYAPRDLALEARSAGFTVERRYEAVDDPADVTHEPDGSWTFKAGARVRVQLSLVAPTRRYHVALVDPLPAGLEPIDPGLPAMGSLPVDPDSPARGGCWWWSRTWYEHSGLRDERAEAFTSLLWAGVHTYSYVTRATTPGEFVVPPAKAEEMYAPETFGRTATDRVTVR